ncbi:MAG TPA: type II toxin-antitoxin system prevent-host-death family antitoxin [Thiobacillus sp.]|nr:MAG: prevent-host-death protein [Hydrogenophilales bacterium 28-61-11]OYZ56660.1 MAG: prevent-host-death protein [Hydrogenophilales bacterium 16-61-112]OZA43770.1 MAG: prevent-host-death protein [Hydrogenophilales bacterium 17-61-76]HQT31582.1 type II toxin-antitoxin system prevent-host-death family antitoxin [Thiobacillus sp.]HQT71073.1 type II toxin-antitoxin system prevent-host-death family antitoxin [Thiobacillus sp.]
MQTVDIRIAKTQLSKLIEQAVQGDSFIIAKAGKPLVKVTRLDPPTAQQAKRLGFMAGQIAVPDDFDCMGSKTVEQLFCDREIRGY